MNRKLHLTTSILVNFKNDKVQEDWDNPSLDKKVKHIVQWAVNFLYRSYGYRATLTEIYREARQKGDVHAYWRAVDMRANDLQPEESAVLERTANGLWQYDYKRPEMKVCYLHNVTPDNPSNLHFHFQVHPNTQVRVTDADLAQGEKEYEDLLDVT